MIRLPFPNHHSQTHTHMSTFMGRWKERPTYIEHIEFSMIPLVPPSHGVLYRWLRIDSIFQALLSATPSATRHSGWGATDFVVSPFNGRGFIAIYQGLDRRLWNLIDSSTETLRREMNFKKLLCCVILAGVSVVFIFDKQLYFSLYNNDEKSISSVLVHSTYTLLTSESYVTSFNTNI